MNILLLSPYDSLLDDFLTHENNSLIKISNRLTLKDIIALKVDYIVSYGYRYILANDIIRAFKNKIINLHISYLPWNRGAHPNVWSVIEDTPKGVTIHYIDKGIDTGDIIIQKLVEIEINMSLSESYVLLHKEIQELFCVNWKNILNGDITSKPQNVDQGTYHTSKDIERINHLLHNGWNTLIKEIWIDEQSSSRQ